MKKSSRFFGLVLWLMGAMALLNNLDKPRVAALRGSEVLGLVSSGGLFGVGFVCLMGRFKDSSSETKRVKEGDRS